MTGRGRPTWALRPRRLALALAAGVLLAAVLWLGYLPVVYLIRDARSSLLAGVGAPSLIVASLLTNALVLAALALGARLAGRERVE